MLHSVPFEVYPEDAASPRVVSLILALTGRAFSEGDLPPAQKVVADCEDISVQLRQLIAEMASPSTRFG